MTKPEGYDERNKKAFEHFAESLEMTREAMSNPIKWTEDFEKKLEDTLRDRLTAEDIFYSTYVAIEKELRVAIGRELLFKLLMK